MLFMYMCGSALPLLTVLDITLASLVSRLCKSVMLILAHVCLDIWSWQYGLWMPIEDVGSLHWVVNSGKVPVMCVVQIFSLITTMIYFSNTEVGNTLLRSGGLGENEESTIGFNLDCPNSANIFSLNHASRAQWSGIQQKTKWLYQSLYSTFKTYTICMITCSSSHTKGKVSAKLDFKYRWMCKK